MPKPPSDAWRSYGTEAELVAYTRLEERLQQLKLELSRVQGERQHISRRCRQRMLYGHKPHDVYK